MGLMIVFSGILIGIPVVNVLFSFGALISLVLSSARYRYSFLVAVCIFSLAACALIYGSPIALIFGYLILIPGAVMGYKARTYSAPFSIVTWGFMPFAVPVLLLIIYYPQLIAWTPQAISETQMTIQEGAALLGLPLDQVQQMTAFVQKVFPWFLRLLPGLLFTTFLGFVFFSYASASAIAGSFGAVLPRITPLYFWKASELWLIPTAISLLFVLIGGGHWLRTAGENMLLFFIHFYAFYGLCLIDYYLREINIPVIIRLVIYLFIILVVIIVVPVMAVIGLIDSRFDFRKLGYATDNQKN